MQIIVTNSEPTSRRLLYKELTDDGYTVILWEDDPMTLKLSELSEPTVIIFDWQQETFSAYLSDWQTTKTVPTGPPVFCLMLISHHDFPTCNIALEMGIDDCLSYPIDLQEVKTRVFASKHILRLKQELQVQKQLLDAELAEAEAYVRSLLPEDLTAGIPIRARFIPSRLLGGDGYDYHWLDPDYLVFYLLDVSGHGIGSALLSTSVLNMLRSQSLPDVNFYRPEKVLKALNDTFQMNEQNEKYFTIWYGVYNRANRQLLYASAGHPPAVLISAQESQPPQSECLKTPGLPIGMLPDIQYSWKRCHVPPSSKLYLFSDGVYEIKQTDNSIMGFDEFFDVLLARFGTQTVDDILEHISSRTPERTFSDDLSLLEIQLD